MDSIRCSSHRIMNSNRNQRGHPMARASCISPALAMKSAWWRSTLRRERCIRLYRSPRCVPRPGPRLLSRQQLTDARKASLLALVLGATGALYLGRNLDRFVEVRQS